MGVRLALTWQWRVGASARHRFFTRVNGERRATPMFVVLICIELSDVLFAVDSIPAVVGISQVRVLAVACTTSHSPPLHSHACTPPRLHTLSPPQDPFLLTCNTWPQDPFIVYSSNIFALMALRSLYMILSKSVQQLHYLRHAVAAILGFVGIKSASLARPPLAFANPRPAGFASLTRAPPGSPRSDASRDETRPRLVACARGPRCGAHVPPRGLPRCPEGCLFTRPPPQWCSNISTMASRRSRRSA